MAVYPYLTWRAYNQADVNRDGEVDSWYSHPGRPVVPLRGWFERYRSEMSVSTREVTDCAGAAFSRWVHEHNLVAQHVTDVELRRIPLTVLRRYAMIAFPDHTEYFERATYEKLLAYRDGGGHLYFFAGNSFYGEVQITHFTIIRRTFRYRTRAISDFRLAATGFRSCCWPASVAPRYHLLPAAFKSIRWLFQGTRVSPGDAFGLALREVDTIDPLLSPPGTVDIASAIVPRFSTTNEAVYGYLGTRPFPLEPGPIRARRVDVAYAPTGKGEVFSWGNNGFLETLFLTQLPGRERAALDRVALNVWRRFTRRGG
jgi:hypothetical protein